MREKELRLALVCYGGISLAIYMHGITKEIWHLVSASRAFLDDDPSTAGVKGAYRQILEDFRADHGIQLRVLTDIIAGASAGGINGIFLAQAIETGQSLELPADAVVFLTHQGYQFTFIQPHGGFDSPVLNYVETESAPKQIADSFAAFLDAELRLMEENHRRSHENGGYYITVRDRSVSFLYPASASGDRATSKPFRLGD